LDDDLFVADRDAAKEDTQGEQVAAARARANNLPDGRGRDGEQRCDNEAGDRANHDR
jgi:hypothetical protein